MAKYTRQAFDFYQQSPSALDANPAFQEDDEMSVLDEKILDPTSPTLSDSRKPSSYDQASDAFSQRNHSLWSDFAPPFLGSNSRQSSQVMFNGPFSYDQQSPWSLARKSGSCTPAASYDQFPSDFDHASTASFSGNPVDSMNSLHQMRPMSYRHSLAYVPPQAVAMSPQSSQGWMPAPTELPDSSSSHRTKSPMLRNSSPLSFRRDGIRESIRDGIRKKNARFDIPAERTLSNIDHLISQSMNEEEVKELKQQKRLLRNRQAALDSRQRKKLHTEKLEEEKKHLTHIITELDDMLQTQKIREAEMLREKGEWLAAHQQINQYIEGMHMEKDELIRVHTLETADLRKKNNILKESVEKLEAQVRMPNASALGSDFSDFDNLTMDGATNNSWDDFVMVNNSSLNAESVSGSMAPSNAMINTSTSANDKPRDKNSSDSPFSWNAFYMCLLFGAFIASNSTNLSSRSIPNLSEEYRAESANVLKAVLSQDQAPSTTNQAAAAPSVSASASTRALPATISGAEMAQMTSATGAQPSSLDELHNTLALPTKEQEQEEAFSLTADEYNSLTTYDESADFKQPQQPTNLQQALSAMRSNSAQNRMHMKPTSDVYSRSLMWDRVPEKVIHDFRRMVQEYGASPVKREDNSNFD